MNQETSITILEPPEVTSDQLDLIKKTIAVGATDTELKLFLYDCSRQGVHPLDKLLHFTKRDGKYTPITSIDFMRTRAADTGEYAGSDDAVFKSSGDVPYSATVTVWRLVGGQRCSFTATARMSEYNPGGKSGFMWNKMPHTMLAKCAEALALRKGFPRQLAGLYAREEMDQAQHGETHQHLSEEKKTPPRATQEQPRASQDERPPWKGARDEGAAIWQDCKIKDVTEHVSKAGNTYFKVHLEDGRTPATMKKDMANELADLQSTVDLEVKEGRFAGSWEVIGYQLPLEVELEGKAAAQEEEAF